MREYEAEDDSEEGKDNEVGRARAARRRTARGGLRDTSSSIGVYRSRVLFVGDLGIVGVLFPMNVGRGGRRGTLQIWVRGNLEKKPSNTPVLSSAKKPLPLYGSAFFLRSITCGKCRSGPMDEG